MADEQPEAVEGAAEEMPLGGTGAILEPINGTVPPSLAVRPQVQPSDLVARLDAIKETAAKAMQEGVDYGKVPGTDKDTLFKPGAEKLGVLFRLDVQLENEKRWEENGHLTVVSRATVYDAPTGARLGAGEGICSTREEKYAFRNAKRKCPACGEEMIIKGREEYGGGWLCFKKLGGCDAKFPDGAQEIEGQEVGKVPNEALADLYNTVDKMASKRARVDAVLAVTGASAIFTQDLAEEGEAQTGGASFPLATGEQQQRLDKALEYLLPPEDRASAKKFILNAFGGELYGSACEAVCAVIRAHKGHVDNERAEAEEARNAEKAASDG